MSERVAFIQWVREFGKPADLVLASGMPGEGGGTARTAARLLLAETLIMLGTLAPGGWFPAHMPHIFPCRDCVQTDTLTHPATHLTTHTPGGTFILQIQEATSLFTNDVLYLLFLCFERIGIHKTHVDPSGGDRLLLCQGFREAPVPASIMTHLEGVAAELEGNVEGPVPGRLFTPDTGSTSSPPYLEFIQHHNLYATMRRLRKLEEVEAWIQDPFGVDYDRPSLCKCRLMVWKLPIVLHRPPPEGVGGVRDGL
jgi:hypothetical protein